MSKTWTDELDARLIRLCDDFVRHADARTVEGDRLDRLPWSSEVNAGYLELTRNAHDHDALLATILAMTPRTLQGLVAKARVISLHQQGQDAEPIPARILAEDVLGLHRSAKPAATDLGDRAAREGTEPGVPAHSSGRR